MKPAQHSMNFILIVSMLFFHLQCPSSKKSQKNNNTPPPKVIYVEKELSQRFDKLSQLTDEDQIKTQIAEIASNKDYALKDWDKDKLKRFLTELSTESKASYIKWQPLLMKLLGNKRIVEAVFDATSLIKDVYESAIIDIKQHLTNQLSEKYVPLFYVFLKEEIPSLTGLFDASTRFNIKLAVGDADFYYIGGGNGVKIDCDITLIDNGSSVSFNYASSSSMYLTYDRKEGIGKAKVASLLKSFQEDSERLYLRSFSLSQPSYCDSNVYPEILDYFGKSKEDVISAFGSPGNANEKSASFVLKYPSEGVEFTLDNDDKVIDIRIYYSPTPTTNSPISSFRGKLPCYMNGWQQFDQLPAQLKIEFLLGHLVYVYRDKKASLDGEKITIYKIDSLQKDKPMIAREKLFDIFPCTEMNTPELKDSEMICLNFNNIVN